MHTHRIREPGGFGQRAASAIIISRNGRSHQINLNPLVVSASAFLLFVLLASFVAATAYQIYRDDLIRSTVVQQATMKHEYEDRIASLRSRLDKVTSRQLLDQQALEKQVQEILQRQNRLGRRDELMGRLLAKAEGRNLGTSSNSGKVPVPQQSPNKNKPDNDNITTGSLSVPAKLDIALLGSAFSLRGTAAPSPSDTANGPAHSTQLAALDADPFSEVSSAIVQIERNQLAEVATVREQLSDQSEQISRVLKSIGIKPAPAPQFGIGGPLQEVSDVTDFDSHLVALETSLDHYDKLAAKLRAAPIGTPVNNPMVSSHFGTRTDPFTGRRAMHSGIDFKAGYGTAVFATGYGKVVKAGRLGGYGNMIEIQHEDGLTTRYGHLKKILVKKGQLVSTGQTIGKVGSTGRSTGPHLHYEVRKSDSAINPVKFLRAGRTAKQIL